MPFREYIRRTYGHEAANLTASYSSCLEKIAKFRNHVAFSVRCKREDVIPPSLWIRSPVDTARGQEIAVKASRQFLNERLRVANYRLRELEDQRKWMEIGLERNFKRDDLDQLMTMSQHHYEKTFVDTREKHQQKFDKFACRSSTSKKKGTNDHGPTALSKSNWIVNLSKHQLTDAEKSALERGLTFSEGPTRIPREEIIAGVEAALCECGDSNRAERARATVASMLSTTKPPKSNIPVEERQALKSLKENKQITILPSDKGRATVILDTEVYEEKAFQLLKNPPFREVQKDPTRRNETRVNNCLKRLLDRKAITKTTYDQLRVPVSGSRPPLFYGTVKIHKPDAPLRPIVSAVGSATYNMAKFISKHLNPYVRNSSSYLVNTRDFIQKLETTTIEDDENLVSFDVKSLFTSVPVDDAIDVINEVLKEDTDFEKRTSVSPQTLMEMLRVCLTATSFQFRSKHYELEDGLAMGSPVSPAVACIFMSKLEERALKTFSQPPSVWYRFVDDIFSIVKRKAREDLLNHLNSQNRSIHFTMEVEECEALPFMDVTVKRVADKQLKTTVYRKQTHTGQYLNFHSNNPDSVKRSVARSLFNRLEYVTLGQNEQDLESNHIVTELEANSYPRPFIEREKRRAKQASRQKSRSSTTDECKVTASIPYVRGLSEAVSRILRPLKIRTVMRSHQRKWELMHRAKDRLPVDTQPGVVYALGCKDCSKVYVGETGRTAKKRTDEHLRHTMQANTDMSAIAQHVLTTNHSIHWKPQIVVKESNPKRRKVREALTIHRLGEKAMNQDKGTNISKLWLE